MSGSTVAFASSPTNFTLGLGGGFTNIGSQKYTSEGGNAVLVAINGLPATGPFEFRYSIEASIKGTTVSGDAEFSLNGPGVSVKGETELNTMLPSIGLPIIDPSNLLGCVPSCSSEIAAFYTGQTEGQANIGGVDVPLQSLPSGILYESAYMNPLGGYLYFGIPGFVDVVSTYVSAVSRWDNVVIQGMVFDLDHPELGQVGGFTMKSSLTENLLSGTETDSGQITLAGFTGDYKALNSAGEFHGQSTVPPGTIDCTAALGFILPPGISICTLTGSHSTGSFNLKGQSGDDQNGGARIKGTYDITWAVPAVGFIPSSTIVSATVTTEDD